MVAREEGEVGEGRQLARKPCVVVWDDGREARIVRQPWHKELTEAHGGEVVP